MNRFIILGICGSLRKGSYNMMALKTAQKLAPDNIEIKIAEIKDLPLFNQDLETDPPPSVLRFRKEVQEADALLLTSPEHNYSVTAALKNALEWGSRPYGKAVMNGKPVGIMGASNGMIGTGRGQHHLRQICIQIDMYPLNKPEVMIPFAQDRFDADGNLNDEKTRSKIKALVEALVEWTKKFS